MKTVDIIKNKLMFLTDIYGFSFSSNSNGKQLWCYFKNSYGSINWYSYEQFGEYELSVVIYGKDKIILDSFQNVNTPFKIKKTISFMNLFRDSRIIYWDEVSKEFKSQISKYGNIFGLKV